MAFSRRSFLRAAALSVGAIGLGTTATGAGATALSALPSSVKEVLQVAVAHPVTPAHRAALARFDDTHAIVDGGVELLLWPGDVARLQATGMPFDIRIGDLLAKERTDAEAERALPASVDIPGGTTDYRDLDEMYAEFDDLAGRAAAVDGLTVEVITLPRRSFEGRTIKAIEISRGDAGDGRGIAYFDGCHHAREWPAAEHCQIFAHHLVEGAEAGDPRINALLESVKVRIQPVVNVDGFVYSRGWAGTLMDNTILGIVAGGQGAYVRKTQRNNPVLTTGIDSEVFYGVDPNRNYAYLWGGTTGSLVNGVTAPVYASTSANPLDQTYYGTEPFSEPETANNRDFFLTNNVITYLSSHTSGRLILRPWGHTTDACPDEALFVDLGARMSQATERGIDSDSDYNGYTSQIGLGLYPTLGTSNDWAYAATGTLGYVIEHSTSFHPGYNSFHGPGATWPGVVEMFMRAAEEAAQPRAYSTLNGTVRDADGQLVAATLELSKSFDTPFATNLAWQPTGQLTAGGTSLGETLALALETDGAFSWHVNPSTRPIAELGGATEAYTLTATTADGRQASTTVEVARGEAVTLDLIVS